MLKMGCWRRPKNPTPLLPQEDPVEPPRTSRDCHDTTALPFLERRRRPVADEQFSKFVEVTKKFYGNIPLLDTMQVPTYTKYLKDILGNKRVLPITEVVQLTDECSIAIVNPLLEKKKKPGYPHHHMFHQSSTLLARSLRSASKHQRHAKGNL